MNLGRVIARSTIGGLFVGHGTQKLFGWFGGPGDEVPVGATAGAPRRSEAGQPGAGE
jgi:putative oxidoreductase